MTCGCDFYSVDPETHDQFLKIETMDPLEAITFVVQLISQDDMGTRAEEPLFGDADDFGRFTAQHNWTDPVAVHVLGNRVDFAAGQAWNGRWLRDHRDSPIAENTHMAADINRRIIALEAWKAEMAEQVTTKKVMCSQIDVDYSLHVGLGTGPRIGIVSEQGEGWAAIDGWAKGDLMGFELTTGDPSAFNSDRKGYAEIVTYGVGERFEQLRHVVIGDDVQVAPVPS